MGCFDVFCSLCGGPLNLVNPTDDDETQTFIKSAYKHIRMYTRWLSAITILTKNGETNTNSHYDDYGRCLDRATRQCYCVARGNWYQDPSEIPGIPFHTLCWTHLLNRLEIYSEQQIFECLEKHLPICFYTLDFLDVSPLSEGQQQFFEIQGSMLWALSKPIYPSIFEPVPLLVEKNEPDFATFNGIVEIFDSIVLCSDDPFRLLSRFAQTSKSYYVHTSKLWGPACKKRCPTLYIRYLSEEEDEEIDWKQNLLILLGEYRMNDIINWESDKFIYTDLLTPEGEGAEETEDSSSDEGSQTDLTEAVDPEALEVLMKVTEKVEGEEKVLTPKELKQIFSVYCTQNHLRICCLIDEVVERIDDYFSDSVKDDCRLGYLAKKQKLMKDHEAYQGCKKTDDWECFLTMDGFIEAIKEGPCQGCQNELAPSDDFCNGCGFRLCKACCRIIGSVFDSTSSSKKSKRSVDDEEGGPKKKQK